jgi:hypothetical protein
MNRGAQLHAEAVAATAITKMHQENQKNRAGMSMGAHKSALPRLLQAGVSFGSALRRAGPPLLFNEVERPFTIVVFV